MEGCRHPEHRYTFWSWLGHSWTIIHWDLVLDLWGQFRTFFYRHLWGEKETHEGKNSCTIIFIQCCQLVKFVVKLATLPAYFWISSMVSFRPLATAWPLNVSTLKLLVLVGKMRNATTVLSDLLSFSWKTNKLLWKKNISFEVSLVLGWNYFWRFFFVPLRVLVFGCDWRSGEKLDSFQSRKVRKTSFGNTVWKFQEFTLTILKNREFPWNQLTFLLLFHKMVFFKWE